MLKSILPVLVVLLFLSTTAHAQNVPIQSYTVNNFGQAELEIQAQADQYYILTAQHQPNLNLETATSMTMGVDGTMVISEPLAAFPLQNYQITAYPIASPNDTDGDGIDDITEFNDMPSQAPLNFANEVPFVDGTVSLDSKETFNALATISENVSWAPFLNDRAFTKFAILNQGTDQAEVYFINSETHFIHANFLSTINTSGATITTGEVVYNPNEVLPNGAIGSYLFNYSFGDAENFEYTRRTYELLAANMPFLENNMSHFISSGGENAYENLYQVDYQGSRLGVILESELFADVDYLPFNFAEGFGFFKFMDMDENPGSRDVVLYDALPNSLPRVGGIITSVVQTPLSHVNLRAIQDNVPNAYIRDPLAIDSIANLIGKYIYYKVDQDRYFIREASLEEVNAWYEDLRPTEEQIPERDLSIISILPLDSIEFEMSTSFGAKCTNVATMRKFGFPEGTIPDGFGVPFYFYDEFMKYNDFYDEVEDMISDPDFINDLETRIEMLKDFRRDIKDADMPQWMLDELQAMHDGFPEGTSVRCRSSTNNEDLPGFSGAGLYTSKTQHPEEGHISKSIKQVYASMWNFRAYDERDFYRVDHYIAAMGVLCHPNYQEEKSNGVGISIDPIYSTENTFYLNTQVGEFLITNPEANSIPEEVLLNTDPVEGYSVLRFSNLVPNGQLVMEEEYLDLMREYLQVIHDEFAILYNVVGAEGFGMDIEYKVTAEDQLIIKQARPWVSFWADIKASFDLAAVEIIEPQSSSSLGDAELITAKIHNQGLKEMGDFEITLLIDGLPVETIAVSEELNPQSSGEYQFTIPQDLSTIGDYNIGTIVSHPDDGYSPNDTLDIVLSKLHFLEGGITVLGGTAKCGNEVEVNAQVTNYGESTFINTAIEVVVNGMAVDTVIYDFSIPYLVTVDIAISVTENLQFTGNEITLNLLSLNGQPDGIIGNNNASYTVDLDSEFDNITFVINTDEYSEETGWQLVNALTNEMVASGGFEAADDEETIAQNICVDYDACFSLIVFDSFGDGICCGFGEGNFFVLNSAGDTLATNDGDFDHQTEELFCPNGEGCVFTADISTTNASSENAQDGTITINPTTGMSPYSYSINGGANFASQNIFSNLSPGIYNIRVQDVTETCAYEETITLGFEVVSNVDDIASGNIKVFPNPTEDILIVTIAENYTSSGIIKIEIYNGLGQLMQNDFISTTNGESTAVLSMKDFAPGSYIAKCYNEDFEEFFKVVKI